MLWEYIDQVLYFSFFYFGYQFVFCFKDCIVKIWSNDLIILLLYSVDMWFYNWSYIQFFQFNKDDLLLLVLGVFLGLYNFLFGEIVVISLDFFVLLFCVWNKFYDVFGCWFIEISFILGNLYCIGDIIFCLVLWFNNVFQDVELENVNVVKWLFKIQNFNVSIVCMVMVVDCSCFDSFDLLLEVGDLVMFFCCIFDLGSDNEEVVVGLVFVYVKEGLWYFLDCVLEGWVQLQLLECMLEIKVVELLVQGYIKLFECSVIGVKSKYFIFIIGCFIYFLYQIGIKQILLYQMIMVGFVLGEGWGFDVFFDVLDYVIDIYGYIIGMGLLFDNRYLYVNSCVWFNGVVVVDFMQLLLIVEEIDLLVFDFKIMWEVRWVLCVYCVYMFNDECFFIFLDVSRDFVVSGVEDWYGYIWDCYYNICLVRLWYEDVVNLVVFSFQEQELLFMVSDDVIIKVWCFLCIMCVFQVFCLWFCIFFFWFVSQRC